MMVTILHYAAYVRNYTHRTARHQRRDAPGSGGRQLVDAGFLIASGEKRGRFYAASPEIVRVRREMRDTRDARDDEDPFAE